MAGHGQLVQGANSSVCRMIRAKYSFCLAWRLSVLGKAVDRISVKSRNENTTIGRIDI